MQTFKGVLDKSSEGLTLSEDMVDELLMINGHMLKMVSIYQCSYCLCLLSNHTCNPVDFDNISF